MESRDSRGHFKAIHESRATNDVIAGRYLEAIKAVARDKVCIVMDDGLLKRLFLVRHARAVWPSEGRNDFNRPLSARGEKNAWCMGKALKQKNVRADLIISSPAARALHTAEIIAAEIDYPRHRIVIDLGIYSGEGDHVLDIILNLDDTFKSVMLIGHNPAMTAVSNHLTDYSVENIHTCGIMCMDFKIDSWKKAARGKSAYVFYDYPKEY